VKKDDPIRILSIPGSGTRFLAQRVFTGAHTYHFGIEGRDQTSDTTIAAWLRAGRPFVPLRDPVLTIITNLNMGRRVYVESFRKMYEWDRDAAIHVVPIEMDHVGSRLKIEAFGGKPDARRDSDHASKDHTGLRAAYWRYLEDGTLEDGDLVKIITDVQKDDGIQMLVRRYRREYRWMTT